MSVWGIDTAPIMNFCEQDPLSYKWWSKNDPSGGEATHFCRIMHSSWELWKEGKIYTWCDGIWALYCNQSEAKYFRYAKPENGYKKPKKPPKTKRQKRKFKHESAHPVPSLDELFQNPEDRDDEQDAIEYLQNRGY